MKKEPLRSVPTHMPARERRKGRHALWIVALISSVFLFFALSYFFLEVTITINPKTETIALNNNLSAVKDSAGKDLSFDLVALSGEESKAVPASGEKEVSAKAKGVVVIYNNFGSSPQRLDINTRLEGSNGKIYKTERQIVVPGKKGDTPGSVEVVVFGAEGGEDYNSGPLDFTIVGFKGTPKYTKFYGRSKGDLTGGFKGMSPVISEEERELAIGELRKGLQEKLFNKISEQIPSGFVLFKDGAFFRVDAETDAGAAGDTALTVSVKGSMYGLLFDEAELGRQIIGSHVTKGEEEEVFIHGIRNAKFALLGPQDISFGEAQKINFSLSGEVKAVWRLDEDEFVASLLGKRRKDFNQILLQYPAVESAKMVISPFWKMSLPDKTKDIKIIVSYPQ